MSKRKPRNKRYNPNKVSAGNLHKLAERVVFHSWKSEEAEDGLPVIRTESLPRVFNYVIENCYPWHVIVLTQCFDSRGEYYEELQEMEMLEGGDINNLKSIVEDALTETLEAVNPLDVFDQGFICRVATSEVKAWLSNEENQKAEAALREKEARHRKAERAAA